MSKREREVAIKNFQIMGYNPDALINSVALLGWRSLRHEKNPSSLEQTDSYYRAEYFAKKDLIEEFDLRRISKNDVKLDHHRFIFLNGEHLRREYYFFNSKERGEALQKFRADMASYLPDCKSTVLKTSLYQMLEVYKIVLPRINFKWEMQQFSYFFTDPDDGFFKREINEMTDKAHKKWLKKLTTNPRFYCEILSDILDLTKRAVKEEGKEFNKLSMNQIISGYLYDRANQAELKNQDVYSALRIALTGYANGPSVGEISEIIEFKTFSMRVSYFVGLLEKMNQK